MIPTYPRLDGLVACVNWPDSFPDRPEVHFSLENRGDRLLLAWQVSEPRSIARVTQDNGTVWKDSCVEFFIRFEGEEKYYNLEASCNGHILLAWRQDRKHFEHAPQEVLDRIIRRPSLGMGITFEECELPSRPAEGIPSWSLELEIPASAFWHSGLKDFSDLHASGNFYKTGDALSRPHYLSWAPIQTEKPDFHRPEFFRELLFR